jgi:hypothetical protein
MARGRRQRPPQLRRRAQSLAAVPAGVARNVPSVAAPENPLRAGMPALDTIHARLVIASPQTPGRTYTILRTTEIDGYELDKAAAAGLAAPGVSTPVPTGDGFQGTARKAAKLSIASGATESLNDLSSLVKSLPADRTMASLHPPITTAATSTRVSKEQRNIRLTAFLYAASHEADNDFHLIVGRDPTKLPETYMTMELSGLPPTTAKSYAKLKAARDAYKGFFSANLPGMTYDFYQPPIPIAVEGSLFFDMSHATGQRPGPPSLKSRMPTIWEVHPITRITFEP